MTGVVLVFALISEMVVLSEPENIPFFSMVSRFTLYAVVAAAVGHVATWKKDFNLFRIYVLLVVLCLFAGIKPIVDWADEGKNCDDMDGTTLSAAQTCYKAHTQLGTSGGPGQASASCASTLLMYSRASGVCPDVRWGGSTGSFYRAYMLIHWLVLFVLNLAGLVLAVYELYAYASLEILRLQEDEDRFRVLGCLAYAQKFTDESVRFDTNGQKAWADLKIARNNLVDLLVHGINKSKQP